MSAQRKRRKRHAAVLHGYTGDRAGAGEPPVVRRRLGVRQAARVAAAGAASSATRDVSRCGTSARATRAGAQAAGQRSIDPPWPLEDILRGMGELRSDAWRAPPDWGVVLPAFPSFPDAVVDRPVLRRAVVHALRSCMPTDGRGNNRIPVVALPASSGTGKTFFLQDVARHGDSHFAECGLGPDLAAWASSVVIFAINFNSDFVVTDTEVELIKSGLLELRHLTALRLVFLELANLSMPGPVFEKVLTKLEVELRAKRCTGNHIYAEARALLQCRGKRGSPNAPVVLLVDEVSKVTTQREGDDLAKWMVTKNKSDSLRDTHGAITSNLLNAANALTDKVGGVTFASSLGYITMSQAVTLSGRRVLPVDNLFCANPEQLSCIIYKGLSSLASQGFMITRDAEESKALCALYMSIRMDLYVARATDAHLQPGANSRLQLQAFAEGLSYLSGGHMRTAVDLAIWLTQAGDLVGPDVPHVSIKMLVERLQWSASSTLADLTWNLADAEDIDNVLSVVLLDLQVSGLEQVFSVTRRAASPLSSSKIPSVWDEARYHSVVLGSGKVFRPRLTPLGLHQVWHSMGAKGCMLYAPLSALVRQEGSSADQRWEQAGCDLEWLQSCCRHLQKPRYKDIRVSTLLNAPMSAYAGQGPLIRNVRVDASHARTGCTRSDLNLLLSQAKRRGDGILLDQVHRLRHNAVGLDAVWFYRVVGGPGTDALVGRLIMIGVQFKFSHATRSGVHPGGVYRDWDNLRKLLGKHYDDWVGRFIYLNYADRNVSSFPNGLTIRAHGRAIPKHCAEHSVIRGRKQLETCVGSTAYHFIRSMHWLYQCNVTGPV